MLTRRATLATLAGAATFAATTVRAQGFPNRPVTIVVPYPAGGPGDTLARLIAQTAEIGQSIVVDPRGGGGGVVGTVAVARAEPDGHTLVLGTNQTHATNHILLKDCPYDGVKDFVPVVGVAELPHMLVVRKDLGVKSVAELIALAKSKPDGLTYGSSGNGSASHLTAELFKAQTGVGMVHVPFRGAAPLLTELVAGRIDLSFATLPGVIAQISAGTITALAVASARRAGRLPDVPTLAESGVAGVEADAWFTLFAPARTPAAVVDQIGKAVAAGLGKDAAKDTFAKLGMRPAFRSSAELARALPAEVEKWSKVIKAANVTAG